GGALAALALGQRLEERLVEEDERRPVEGADEVLAVGDVDAGLAADRGVDLPDERRRHRRPPDSAQIRRRGEARDVRRASPAEGDDGAFAVESELAPEARDHRRLLCLLARRQLVRRLQPRAERLLRARPVDAHHVRVRAERDRAVAGNKLAEPVEAAALRVHARRGEHRRLRVVRDGVGDLAVERLPVLVEPAEQLLVLGERPRRPSGAAPGEVDVDVDEEDELRGERRAGRRARDRTAPECDDGGLRCRERDPHRVLLDPPELLLPALGEERRDRRPRPLLDRGVEVEERTAEPLRELLAERRLPRSHEPDEGDVAPERVQRRQAMRSRYALHAPTKSSSASPPNFSRAARASSHATAASATTASASTAATSERSTSACAGSPVCRSTDASGFISVGSGFIAARTTISSPFEMPASIPPARFVSRRRSTRISSWASEP